MLLQGAACRSRSVCSVLTSTECQAAKRRRDTDNRELSREQTRWRRMGLATLYEPDEALAAFVLSSALDQLSIGPRQRPLLICVARNADSTCVHQGERISAITSFNADSRKGGTGTSGNVSNAPKALPVSDRSRGNHTRGQNLGQKLRLLRQLSVPRRARSWTLPPSR